MRKFNRGKKPQSISKPPKIVAWLEDFTIYQTQSGHFRAEHDITDQVLMESLNLEEVRKAVLQEFQRIQDKKIRGFLNRSKRTNRK
ncbi:MAG: hypothetical protein JJ975_15905 [Bacteroidia bacterium]|nr:hypothetical protein [Bacteroidia bacterium]